MSHRPTGSLVKVDHFGRERAGIILEWEFATIFADSIEEVQEEYMYTVLVDGNKLRYHSRHLSDPS